MDRLRPDARVRTTEYGTGTIVSVAGNRIIICRPMPDSRTHRLGLSPSPGPPAAELNWQRP
jgi:hypothetical protein